MTLVSITIKDENFLSFWRPKWMAEESGGEAMILNFPHLQMLQPALCRLPA
jgi:hypothetical protein